MVLTSEKLEKIVFEAPAWKILFYKFMAGRIKLIDLEQEVYKLSELESIIGEDAYIELVSFNFANYHIYNDVVKMVLGRILIDEDENHCKLFGLICDFYTNDIEARIEKSTTLAEAVVNIFEGAHIIPIESGIDKPSCDVEFLLEVKQIKRTKYNCQIILPSNTVTIGYAYQSGIELLMDNDGIVYIHVGIINYLYCGGDFFDALIRLFLGLDYGELLYPPSMAQGVS